MQSIESIINKIQKERNEVHQLHFDMEEKHPKKIPSVYSLYIESAKVNNLKEKIS